MTKICTLLFLSFFLFTSCKFSESEESKITDVCNTFMEGRKELENGDSLKLKTVTSDTLFRLIMLNYKYSKALESNFGSSDLNIFPKSVEIKGNTAVCVMSSEENYKINLQKINNSWKVRGENDRFPDAAALERTQKKLDDYMIYLKGKPTRDSVLQIANRFLMDANFYFKNSDPSRLKENCDDASADFVKRLFSYAKKRSGTEIITEELNQPNSSAGEIKFYNDKAVYLFYQESASILLEKKGNVYKVIGFNGIKSKSITQQIMEQEYVELLRSVRLVRSEQYRDKNIK